MGVDIPYVEQIIHITPPHTLEGYMQEVGRGARASTHATATIYYNNADISDKIKRPVHAKMREYCLMESPGKCLVKLETALSWNTHPHQHFHFCCPVSIG